MAQGGKRGKALAGHGGEESSRDPRKDRDAPCINQTANISRNKEQQTIHAEQKQQQQFNHSSNHGALQIGMNTWICIHMSYCTYKFLHVFYLYRRHYFLCLVTLYLV